MRDNLSTMLRAAAKEWREKNKVVATGATRYDAALEEAADAIEELQKRVPKVPHGRLGDLDKLENGLRHMAKYQHGERQQGILGCCETIRLAPTIIPAEEE